MNVMRKILDSVGLMLVLFAVLALDTEGGGYFTVLTVLTTGVIFMIVSQIMKTIMEIVNDKERG